MPNNFSLQSTSPCINAGVDVGLIRDYAGSFVPCNATPDIGAFEYIDIQPAVLALTSTVLAPTITAEWKSGLATGGTMGMGMGMGM